MGEILPMSAEEIHKFCRKPLAFTALEYEPEGTLGLCNNSEVS